MDKKISLFLALIFSFLFISNVHASTYTDTINEHGMWISNEFINKTKNGSTKYQQMTMIVRNSDGRYLYCIEPGKSIDEDSVFTGYDDNQASHADITDDVWNRINLIAYYGYGYTGHENIKWYVVTQYMIWQTNNLGYDIYFTDRLNGNRITKYEDEINEIENLINNHYSKPEFQNEYIDLLIGEDYTLIDNNNVLQNYSVNSNIEFYTYNNELHLKNDNENITSGNIEFIKKSDRFSNDPIVYIDSISQDLLLPGKLEDIKYSLNYNTIYGSLHMYKVDSEWIIRNQASLENAVYAIYDSNYNLLEEKKTNEYGEIYFDSKFKKGEYILKELEPSKGYMLDYNEYHIIFDKDAFNHNWNVGEQVIKENYEITKYIYDNNIIKPESNIEFGLYDDNDNLIDIYNTDDYGKIYFSLDYGNYTLKQHSVYPGYEKIKDYDFMVKENDKYNQLIFIDKLIEEDIEETKDEEDPVIEEQNQVVEEQSEEYIPEIDEEVIEEIKEDILVEEELVVEVPNTLKNSNTSLLCLLLFAIYIKKKLL